MKEREYYPALKKALKEYLERDNTATVQLAITSNKIPEWVKSGWDDVTAYAALVTKKKPDIMGYLQSKNEHNIRKLLSVEFKVGELNFEDIYQLKMYAELFDSDLNYLISTEPVNSDLKRFLEKRRGVLAVRAAYYQIEIFMLGPTVDGEYMLIPVNI